MRLPLITIFFLSLTLLSCDDDDHISLPETGYIKAKINGIETLYSGTVHEDILHYIGDDELNISFHNKDDQFLTWTITIRGVDFQNIELPYEIRGPKEGGFDEPAFWCHILDSNPKNSTYGRTVAATTSVFMNAKLTLTAIEGNMVRGTFSGIGLHNDTFTNGKFMAIFK